MTFLYFPSKRKPGTVYVDRPASLATAGYGSVRAAIDLDLVVSEETQAIGRRAAVVLEAIVIEHGMGEL